MVTRATRVSSVAASAAMAAVLAGCPVEIPDGRFGCSRGEACPPDMVCGAEGLCVRVASGRDAGANDAGANDAGAIDASGIDASGNDARGVDAFEIGRGQRCVELDEIPVLGGQAFQLRQGGLDVLGKAGKAGGGEGGGAAQLEDFGHGRNYTCSGWSPLGRRLQ